MPSNRHAFRAVLTLAGVVALSLANSTPAAAAIIGSLTASEAQPGDRVTLEAQGPAGETQTVYLISTSDFEKQIARFGRQVCNTPGQFALGSFTWNGDIGSLTFTVPSVGPGRYYFQVQVRNTPQNCWRIGGQSGPLVLTALAGAGGTDVPGPSPVNPLVGLVLIAAAGVATAVIARLTRRPG
jgi:hypothetical protein